MGLVEWVVGESGNDVGVEFFLVHDNCCMENRFEYSGSSERGGHLFLRKHWAEVARIYCCIVTISPFGVDVPSSSERVGLSAQAPRAEVDDEVKL